MKDIPLRPPIEVSKVSDAVSLRVLISYPVLNEYSFIEVPDIANNLLPLLLNINPFPRLEIASDITTPATPLAALAVAFIVDIS